MSPTTKGAPPGEATYTARGARRNFSPGRAGQGAEARQSMLKSASRAPKSTSRPLQGRSPPLSSNDRPPAGRAQLALLCHFKSVRECGRPRRNRGMRWAQPALERRRVESREARSASPAGCAYALFWRARMCWRKLKAISGYLAPAYPVVSANPKRLWLALNPSLELREFGRRWWGLGEFRVRGESGRLRGAPSDGCIETQTRRGRPEAACG